MTIANNNILGNSHINQSLTNQTQTITNNNQYNNHLHIGNLNQTPKEKKKKINNISHANYLYTNEKAGSSCDERYKNYNDNTSINNLKHNSGHKSNLFNLIYIILI